MNPQYSVRVTKDYLVFSAGHFITYGDNVCERLHGHNYRVAADIAGPLEENQYVVDFIAIRDALKTIVDELDHRMLLPTQHKHIHVTPDAREVLVTFADRRWVFPLSDCVLLPVSNTTSELLARHIGEKLITSLRGSVKTTPDRLRIEVDECFGQIATCELSWR
jgi:6-pyruvoyltetrahydropterin/6-carboxytetrahydropterin synthase